MKGRKNVYTCQTCGAKLVTVDRDQGTTPFMTKCVKGDCVGSAQSSFYNVDQTLTATHEWYRVTDQKELIRLSRAGRNHHEMGGLFIREISAAAKTGLPGNARALGDESVG